ncbi:putative thiamine transporter SLC35F3 [Penaeus monodon]|uniref:putative thiamine transporter SLC35F3 n=1 Tax=Penaeus monodon TaxID=6687 RepID=UPI0018A78899|nr:putative thiamine transporter SLC35F3 [Penaeus monodon]
MSQFSVGESKGENHKMYQVSESYILQDDQKEKIQYKLYGAENETLFLRHRPSNEPADALSKMCRNVIFQRDMLIPKFFLVESLISSQDIWHNYKTGNLTTVLIGKFMTRCCLFCLLWVVTNYMYVYSLRILDCTDVMALYSAHVSFVYLLSWVILHDQFVGVRIVAVILCNTGIALLAYMDGITKTKTLGGVVLAAAAAAGSAVYKVLFKKVIGEASFGQVSFIFTIIALLNTVLLSPLVAAFYFSGYEVIEWRFLPWPNLVIAAALSLAANLLGNFAIAFTFEIFITLGLVLAVPVSAVLDTKWYAVQFQGMKLAGVVLIMCGFFLVLFPANWPEYITKVLRWGRHRKRNQPRQQPEPVDYRTGLISRSHLRSPSGLIR